MIRHEKLPVVFYRLASGEEPVRSWLRSLPKEDRDIIGKDILKVQWSWPVGPPLCGSMTGYKGLWELRSSVTHGKIARVFFCLKGECLVLLHGFIKKSQKTPQVDREIAWKRKKEVDSWQSITQ